MAALCERMAVWGRVDRQLRSNAPSARRQRKAIALVTTREVTERLDAVHKA